MKIYDGNFINLSVNGKKFMDGEKTNSEICLNDESILAGENIVVEKLPSGKIRISVLGAVEPNIPVDNLYFTSSLIGIFRMTVGLQTSGTVDIYYRNSSRPVVRAVSSNGTEIDRLFKRSTNRKTYVDDSGNSITIFKCNNMSLNSLSLVDNAGIKTLDINNNNISYLDLTQNTNLEYVDISNNPISEITCYSLFLDKFIAENCNLSEVTLSSLTIDTLDLSGNKELSNINVNLSGVKHLNLSGSGINEIEISNYSIIEDLILDSSNVKRINLRGCNKLENLSFNDCQVNNFYAGGFALTSGDVKSILRTIYNSGVYNGTLVIESSEEYESDIEILSLESILRFRGWFIVLHEESDSSSISESSSSSSTWESDSASESSSESESYNDIDVFVPRIIEYNNISGKVVVIPQVLVNGVYVDDPDREPIEVDF